MSGPHDARDHDLSEQDGQPASRGRGTASSIQRPRTMKLSGGRARSAAERAAVLPRRSTTSCGAIATRDRTKEKEHQWAARSTGGKAHPRWLDQGAPRLRKNARTNQTASARRSRESALSRARTRDFDRPDAPTPRRRRAVWGLIAGGIRGSPTRYRGACGRPRFSTVRRKGKAFSRLLRRPTRRARFQGAYGPTANARNH
jgi:hypothetical protein